MGFSTMKKCSLALALLLSSAAAQLTPNVEITRPTYASDGDAVTLRCRQQTQMQNPDDTCNFYRPDGVMVTVNFLNGDVKDSAGDDVAGYTGMTNTNRRICGLEIASVDERVDIGQWSCQMDNDMSSSFFRMGTFQLLTPAMEYLSDVRLPRHLSPYLHSIDLVPQLDGDYEVAGAMRLIAKNFAYDPADDEYLKKVYMHAKDIVIDEEDVMVRTFTKDNVVIGHEYDLEREFYVIHLNESLWVQSWDTYHLVNFTFTSYLNDDLRGFYRSTYDNEDGDPITIASTQFQYIDARRAFPCMDEPDMKSRFQISIEHDEDLTATSNMPILSTTEGGQNGWVKDTFRLSELMSPYLIAFMVSDFVNTTGTVPLERTNFNIIHPAGKGNQAELAADAGPTILTFFEEYFDIPYPLPKVDMAAIPDFKYGAMENWGLITYRESALLFDEDISTQSDRDRVIEVIAHELAHMWFGNLVTLEWWEDLWLNEGFATYVENIGKDEYDSNLQSRDRVVLDDLHDVFEIDSLESSLPLSTPVGNPDYDMTFSRLSYGKGNCVLRMIENFISLDAFNSGIQTYLKQLAYDNADRADLWAYLDAAAHVAGTLDTSLKVGTIMEGWTAKEGYPVVTVGDVSGKDIQLSQKRFFLSPSAPEPITNWWIPLNMEYPGGSFDDTSAKAWMSDNGAPLTTSVDQKPYILNVKQTGYYRVNYDNENWDGLRTSLMNNNQRIDRLNRAQIIDDSFNLARAGQLDYEVPLLIAEYLVNEEDFIPLKASLNNFAFLDLMFRTETADYGFLKNFVQYLFSEKFDDFGFIAGNNEVYFDALIRDELITWMCKYEYGTCVEDAQNQFSDWMDVGNPDNNNPIPLDIKSPVYETAIRAGDDAEWDFLYARLEASKVGGERSRMIYGLGSTEKVSTINSFLGMSIDSTSAIRKQDASAVYRAFGRSDIGRITQFDWLKDNFDDIKTYFDTTFTSQVNEIVSVYSNGAKTQAEIDNLQDFYNDNQADLASSSSTIIQSQDTIRVNMAWNEANYETVATWLDDFDPANTRPPMTPDPNATTDPNVTEDPATVPPPAPGSSVKNVSASLLGMSLIAIVMRML